MKMGAEKIIVTGHQPVYLPWLGLFHKISLANIFIFMDDVQYLEKDWNNRNKIKTPHGPKWLTVPVSVKKSASPILKDIVIDTSRRGTKDDWQLEHWKTIEGNYKRAPHFNKYAGFFQDMYVQKTWEKLADLNEYQLKYFLKEFGISIEYYKASVLQFTQKKSDLVLEHCLKFKADICVTGALGKNYIKEEDFAARKIKVYYQNYSHPSYNQLWGEFAPFMSVIDLLFNHGAESWEIIAKGNILKEDLIRESVLN